MIRCDVGERARDRNGGQRVVGRRLDDGVAPGDHRSQDRDRRDQATVACRDVQHPGSEGAHPQFSSVGQRLWHPAVEIAESDLSVGDLEHVGAGEQRSQDLVAVLQHFRRKRVRRERRLVCLLKVRVSVEVQCIAQSLEHDRGFRRRRGRSGRSLPSAWPAAARSTYRAMSGAWNCAPPSRVPNDTRSSVMSSPRRNSGTVKALLMIRTPS